MYSLSVMSIVSFGIIVFPPFLPAAFAFQLPSRSSMDTELDDFVLQQNLNDVIEVLALNQIQLKEMINEVIDEAITNNTQKLKDIRQQIDD